MARGRNPRLAPKRQPKLVRVSLAGGDDMNKPADLRGPVQIFRHQRPILAAVVDQHPAVLALPNNQIRGQHRPFPEFPVSGRTVRLVTGRQCAVRPDIPIPLRAYRAIDIHDKDAVCVVNTRVDATRDGVQEAPLGTSPNQCAIGAGFPRLAGDNQPGGVRVQHGIQAPL